MTSGPEDRKIVTVEQLTRYIFNEGPIVPFDDLEPAPPKDWRPACYQEKSYGYDACYEFSPGRFTVCRNCPYHNLE